MVISTNPFLSNYNAARLLLTFFLTLSSNAYAADTNAERVQKAAPYLYQAFLRNLGPEQTERFFSYWTQTEIDSYLEAEKISRGRVLKKKSEGRQTLSGPIGEAFALGHTRLHYFGPKDRFILSDKELRPLMPQDSRPDSIIGRIEGDKFIIEQVIQTKIVLRGSNSGVGAQQLKFVEVLKNSGLSFLYEGKAYTFNPSQVELELPTKTVAATKLTLNDLSSLSQYYLAEGKGNKPNTYNIPISAELLKIIGQDIYDSLAIDFQDSPEAEFNRKLRRWFHESSTWPHSEDASTDEGKLAETISNLGGREAVFVKLPTQLQHLIFRNQLPLQQDDVLKALEQADPELWPTRSALGYFLRKFPDRKKVKERLSHLPNWKKILRSLDILPNGPLDASSCKSLYEEAK